MDIQFWIWLIIIVITLVARARRKPQSQPRRDSDAGPQERPGLPPMSFEDLLKEIQSAKEPREVGEAPFEPVKPRRNKPVYRQPEPSYREVDYDDDLREEAQGLETVIDDRKAVNIYEEAKQQAFARPSLEETMKLEDTVVRFGQFKEYESHSDKAPISDILAELGGRDGLKKAFVMSEILKTKF